MASSPSSAPASWMILPRAFDPSGAQPQKRQHIGQIHQPLRLTPLLRRKDLPLVLPVKQLLQARVHARRQSKSGQVPRHFQLYFDDVRHASSRLGNFDDAMVPNPKEKLKGPDRFVEKTAPPLVPTQTSATNSTHYLHTLQTGVHNASSYKLNHFRSCRFSPAAPSPIFRLRPSFRSSIDAIKYRSASIA